MTYEDFIKFVQSKCMHETIYEDSEGRLILVIDMLDAYSMVNKASQPTGFVNSKLNPRQRTWVDLTKKEVDTIRANAQTTEWAILMAQSTLKEKNT